MKGMIQILGMQCKVIAGTMWASRFMVASSPSKPTLLKPMYICSRFIADTTKKQTTAAKQAALRTELAAQQAEVARRTAAEAAEEAAYAMEQAQDMQRFAAEEAARKQSKLAAIDKLKVRSALSAPCRTLKFMNRHKIVSTWA